MCSTKPAKRLCAIHVHVRAVNKLRTRMGKSPIKYGWLAEKYPARRDKLLKYWTKQHRHTKHVYKTWRKQQSTSPVALGQMLAAQRGWTGAQWSALYTLWNHESGWSPTAVNPNSGACGIPQFYPCHDFGNVEAQIVAGLSYISGRYGTPESALAFWNANGWY